MIAASLLFVVAHRGSAIRRRNSRDHDQCFLCLLPDSNSTSAANLTSRSYAFCKNNAISSNSSALVPWPESETDPHHVRKLLCDSMSLLQEATASAVHANRQWKQ